MRRMLMSKKAYTALSNAPFPGIMKDALIRFYDAGLPPGSFLTAVIENDLLGAVNHADERNSPLLAEYVKFFYNHIPMSYWGYKGAVRDYHDLHYPKLCRLFDQNGETGNE